MLKRITRDEEMADTETFRVPKFNTFRVRFRHVFTRYEALRVMRFSIYFFIRTTRLCKSIGSSGWEILPACLPAPVWAAEAACQTRYRLAHLAENLHGTGTSNGGTSILQKPFTQKQLLDFIKIP